MQPEDVPLSITDIVDFYRQWPDLRIRVLDHMEHTENTSDAEILDWMVRIIDRIGPQDLSPDSRK